MIEQMKNYSLETGTIHKEGKENPEIPEPRITMYEMKVSLDRLNRDIDETESISSLQNR